MPRETRVAAYYVPGPDDPLFALGATWLGRDPESGAPTPQPDLPGIARVTEDPRLYGFHATLKPPMRLAEGRSWRALVADARALAARIAPFALPPLAVAEPHGFLALRETAPCRPLQELADAAVEALDPYRAPPSADELARRRRHGLTPKQDAMLTRWGYPYVFDTWFFHMTLTRRLGDAERPAWAAAARAHFAPALALPRRVEGFCLCVQTGPGAPFVVAERLGLGGGRTIRD